MSKNLGGTRIIKKVKVKKQKYVRPLVSGGKIISADANQLVIECVDSSIAIDSFRFDRLVPGTHYYFGFVHGVPYISSSIPPLTKPQNTAVVHPSHYAGNTAHEVWDCLEAWKLHLNAYLWTAVKYLARAGKKDPNKYVEDLEKAKQYIDREISRVKERS